MSDSKNSSNSECNKNEESIKPIDTPSTSQQKNESTFDSEEMYSASGVKSTLHGVIYQLKLLMLFAWLGKQKGYGFRLATEMNETEKFDDIVFNYSKKHNSQKLICFLQAKHIQDKNQKIKESDFLKKADDKFSLPKYFQSFCKVKKNQKFRSAKMSFVICTNIDLNFEVVNTQRSVKKVCGKKGLYFEKVSSENEFSTFIDSGDCYCFAKDTKIKSQIVDLLHKLFEETSDMKQLAYNLAEYILEKKTIVKNNVYFKEYQYFLVEHIFNAINKDTTNISTTFASGELEGNPIIKQFRELLRHSVESYIEKLRKNPDQVKKSLEDIVDNIVLCRKPGPKEQKFDEAAFWKELGKIQIKLSKQFKEIKNCKRILPSNGINQVDVEDFVDQMIFAVNQPNEEELSILISKCLGDEFNLIDVNLLTDSFQNNILNWFKKKQGENKYLFREDIDEFFEEMRGKIALLNLTGVSNENVKKIEDTQLVYKSNVIDKMNDNLLSFISGSQNGIFCYITPSRAMFLESIKIWQVLRNIEQYKKTDSYLILNSENIRQLQEKQQYFSNLLIIIEYQSGDISKILSLGNNNKIIIITDNETFNKDNNFKYCKEEEIQFHDFESSSQEILLQREVTFQGEQLLLNNIIFDKSDRNTIIDHQIIEQLITNKCINIALDKSKTTCYFPDYYIKRRLKLPMLNKEILKENCIFVINGDSCFKEDYTLKDNVHYFEENNFKAASDKFQSLKNSSDIPIHWLLLDNDEYLYSLGTLNSFERSIQRYYMKGKVPLNYPNLMRLSEELKTDLQLYHNKWIPLNEDNLVDFNMLGKVVLISATAGMGKSMILTSLEKRIKNLNKYKWVIRINLNDCSEVFDKEIESPHKTYYYGHVESAINFLINAILAPQCMSCNKILTENILKHGFAHGEVILLVDGFDEISPDYEKIVLNLLTDVSKSRIAKLFVTTRPNKSEILENKLNIFSFGLDCFNEYEAYEFLEGYWRNIFDLSDYHKIKTKDYIQSLIQYFNKINCEDLYTIPQLIMMMAKIFETNHWEHSPEWDGFSEFIKSSSENPKLPTTFNLYDLYELFFRKMFYIYYREKKGIDMSKAGLKSKYNRELNQCITQHQTLALFTIFNRDDLEIILPENSEPPAYMNTVAEENMGIMSEIVNNKPKFVHRSFGEQLATGFIADKIKKSSISNVPCGNEATTKFKKYIISKLLLKPDEYTFVRVFLNHLLSRDQELFDALVSFSDVLIDTWNTGKPFKCTWFHVAVNQKLEKVIEVLLKCLDGNEHKNEIGLARSQSGNTALYEAAKLEENSRMNIVKTLISEFYTHITSRLCPNEILFFYRAIEDKQLDIIKRFEENDTQINLKKISYCDIFYKALEVGDLEFAKWLLVEKGADINVFNNSFIQGGTALYRAVTTKNIHIMKWLVENGADINFQNAFTCTALHNAVSLGHFDIIQWLVENGAAVNAKHAFGGPVHEDPSCKLCIRNKNRQFSLEYAAQVYYTNGIDINATKPNCMGNYEKSVLDYTYRSDSYEIIDYLVSKGAKYLLHKQKPPPKEYAKFRSQFFF